MNGDTDSNDSNTSATSCDQTIIDKILGQMKSEFNKTEKPDEDVPEVPPVEEAPLKTEQSTNTNDGEVEADKPRIVLSFKKPPPDKKEPTASNRRSLRQKPEDVGLKRSSRRRSKDCESVLQSAIARKEKSYNESNKPQRLTRQLKPTQKILENLALAKQEAEENDKFYRKHKHKHSKHKKAKRLKGNNGESASESEKEEGGLSRFKDCEEPSGQEEKEEKRLCLCTMRTQYFLESNEEDITYCAAVDTIDDKTIGCSRTIDTKEIMLLRCSTRVPYVILCEAHKNRLLRHNCCPTCGVFCTQGCFLECESKHHYHKDCQLSVGDTDCCPHCGSTSVHQIEITMRTEKRPIFLPVQKTQYASARMSFPNNHRTDEEKSISPPLLPIGDLEMQNSLEYGDDEYELSELILAVKNNSLERVAIILASKSIDVNCKIPECNDGTVLHLAAQKGNVSIVHMLIVSGAQTDTLDKDQNTALMTAVLTSNNEIVRYLIKAGASITLKGTDGMTALHLAAKCGNLKACELLISGAKNLKNFINCQDDGGWTPLVWACEHGYEDVANFLIYKGADASLRDLEHNVALHWAAFSGSSHIAELLLDKDCDVNAVNAHGDTPLHIGARQDMYNCNIVLLARGADVTLLNKNNESPLDCVPPGGDSYSPISLNISLQASIEFGCQNVILANDISKGKELNPIQCYNNVDDDPKPTDFKYITKNCISSDDVKIENKITSLQYCQCEERCVDDGCQCGKLSVRCWYNEEGKLIPEFNFGDIPMIFECNDQCSCNAITCNNRVVQRGLTQRFELFKTIDRGWGIRTLRVIPKGSFVCEYVGEIITDLEADRREDDSFLFDLENRVCKNNDVDSYCIDAKFYGNFARFINHSCSPNLTSVKVFIDHQDLRFPRIAFFANRDILSDEELSFDYGAKFWFTKYKSLSCLCGSEDCRYSEDAIEMTLQNHQVMEESG